MLNIDRKHKRLFHECLLQMKIQTDVERILMKLGCSFYRRELERWPPKVRFAGGNQTLQNFQQ